MTLKSNKNEPAVLLEPASSVRTALSDLYLEHLLQNKPKPDKVKASLCLLIYLFYPGPFSLGQFLKSLDFQEVDPAGLFCLALSGEVFSSAERDLQVCGVNPPSAF